MIGRVLVPPKQLEQLTPTNDFLDVASQTSEDDFNNSPWVRWFTTFDTENLQPLFVRQPESTDNTNSDDNFKEAPLQRAHSSMSEQF
jgi:hypothetical protein